MTKLKYLHICDCFKHSSWTFMSKFKSAEILELDLVELKTTNENPQWKKLSSVKFDVWPLTLVKPRQQCCRYLPRGPRLSCLVLTFEILLDLTEIFWVPQKFLTSLQFLTFIAENFQIPVSYFRIHVKNGERLGFSYEMLMMVFFPPTAYFTNHLIRGVAQTPWIPEGIICIS